MSNPTIPHKNTLTSLLQSSKKNYYAHQFDKAKKYSKIIKF